MPTAEEIQSVSEIFISMKNHIAARQATGKRLRDEMHDQIERGERPTGYRPDWLRSSATKVIKDLFRLGVEFNDLHRTDAYSVEDLRDILTTALNHLKKADG